MIEGQLIVTTENEGLVKFTVIESEKAGPHVLFIAGIHGDEYEPMLVGMQLVPEISSILTKGKVTIVSVANHSAYQRTNRTGEDDLDLARICPGNSHGTVSERAAAQISSMIKDADYLIDMHTGGITYSLYPLAGYLLHPSANLLKKQQEMADAFNLPLIWGTDHRVDGRTLSVARDAGIPAIYLEYGGGTGIRNSAIVAYKRGCINFLHYLNMLKNSNGSMSRIEKYWLEDHRSNSGYLQGKMPSPADGVFVAEVQLGEQVKEGEIFGKVIDPLTGTSTIIYADCDGLVLMLRTLVKVNSGDTLGGILPVVSSGKKIIIYDN